MKTNLSYWLHAMLQCSVCCQKQRRFFVRGILVFLAKKTVKEGKYIFIKIENRKASALGTLDQKRRWLFVTWAEWAVTVRELIIWCPVKCVNNYAGHFASNDHLQSLALLFNLGRQIIHYRKFPLKAENGQQTSRYWKWQLVTRNQKHLLSTISVM